MTRLFCPARAWSSMSTAKLQCECLDPCHSCQKTGALWGQVSHPSLRLELKSEHKPVSLWSWSSFHSSLLQEGGNHPSPDATKFSFQITAEITLPSLGPVIVWENNALLGTMAGPTSPSPWLGRLLRGLPGGAQGTAKPHPLGFFCSSADADVLRLRFSFLSSLHMKVSPILQSLATDPRHSQTHPTFPQSSALAMLITCILWLTWIWLCSLLAACPGWIPLGPRFSSMN